jgi:hypothetical protein
MAWKPSVDGEGRGAMTRDQVQGLAKATCYWLAYKHVTGFEETLGEAMLAIPISEYLTRSIILNDQTESSRKEGSRKTTSWKLESEVLYKSLELAPAVPELSCDFAGIPSSASKFRFILETKFLKTKADNVKWRIMADLIRLSLSFKIRLRRYFLLAGYRESFLGGSNDVLGWLLKLEPGHGKYFNPRATVQSDGPQSHFSRFVPLLEKDYLSHSAFIYCGAKETVMVGKDIGMQVGIWSVGGSEPQASTAFEETDM